MDQPRTRGFGVTLANLEEALGHSWVIIWRQHPFLKATLCEVTQTTNHTLPAIVRLAPMWVPI